MNQTIYLQLNFNMKFSVRNHNFMISGPLGNHNFLSSNISNRYSIDDINKAIQHYSENMSEGKSIFIFNQ